MKKLSEKNRRHFCRKSAAGSKGTRRTHERSLHTIQARQNFIRRRGELPDPALSYEEAPGFLSFDPPSVFDIYDNFEETLAFLLDIRSLEVLIPPGKRLGRPILANFAKIQHLDAASGLLIAAEIDRWRRTSNARPVPHDHQWEESVRDFFHDAGLFELLGIDPKTARSNKPVGVKTQSIRFQTGTFHEGETAERFREDLEQIIGKPLGPRVRVYDAISEAMTNVARHAYPRDTPLWPTPLRNRWWLGGSWLSEERIATVQLYDQGVGIPRTLPRSKHWSEVLPILGRIDRERTDAGMIEAAMDYGRTSTGRIERGKGLAQMAEWIRTAGNGSLRILSGRGALTYLPGSRPVRQNLPGDFQGTLIEWKVHL